MGRSQQDDGLMTMSEEIYAGWFFKFGCPPECVNARAASFLERTTTSKVILVFVSGHAWTGDCLLWENQVHDLVRPHYMYLESSVIGYI